MRGSRHHQDQGAFRSCPRHVASVTFLQQQCSAQKEPAETLALPPRTSAKMCWGSEVETETRWASVTAQPDTSSVAPVCTNDKDVVPTSLLPSKLCVSVLNRPKRNCVQNQNCKGIGEKAVVSFPALRYRRSTRGAKWTVCDHCL